MILHFFRFRIHPLLYITTAYMVGICIPATLPQLAALVFLGTCVLALLWKKYTRLRSVLPIIAGCLLAHALGGIRIEQVRSLHSRFFLTSTKCHDIIATINTIDHVDHPTYNQCLTLSLSKIKKHNDPDWQKQTGIIQIYTKKNNFLSSLRVGDCINIESLVFKKPTNQKFVDYLIKEGIATTLFILPLTGTLIQRPQYSLSRWIFYTKTETLARIKRKMSPRAFQLFSSIFLGNKQSPKKLTETTKNHFSTWGVTHYLARSGLHMVIFVFVWQLFLNTLPLPWLFKEITIVALCLGYNFLSWPSVSFNRALLTFLIYKWCAIMKLSTNFLHLLVVVCLLILLHNPMQLFFLDFQLSFGLTFALACFNQVKIYHKHTSYNYKTIAS